MTMVCLHSDTPNARARVRVMEFVRSVRSYQRRAPRCGARTRGTGKPCQCRALANGRCRFHGGLSTGPKTAEGRRRALANLTGPKTSEGRRRSLENLTGPKTVRGRQRSLANLRQYRNTLGVLSY